MDFRQLKKSIVRFFGRLGLSFCFSILGFLSLRQLYTLAKVIAKIASRVSIRQKQTALEGLSAAFNKEKSTKEIKRIAGDCFVYLAEIGAEICFL